MTTSRRAFLETSALGATGGLLATSLASAEARAARSLASAASIPLERQPIAIFSKHLQWLDYPEAAAAAREAGFDALDIPVRPEGHVLPERVRDDLPRAVEAAERAGLRVTMITTHITGVDSAHARTVLETAAGLGVRDYRLGYVSYEDGVRPTLNRLVPRFRELAALNEEAGIRGGYQNHSGSRFGAPVWDLSRVLDAVGSPWIGVQYDIRHAVVEGAYSWARGLEMVAPFVHTLVAKDFDWEKTPDGWHVRNVPLGEGMVPVSDWVKELRGLGISAPFSMHFEYPHPDEGRRAWAVAAYRRDLDVLKTALRSAD